MVYVTDNDMLAQEWDYEKNKKLGLDPQKLVIGSGKKAWWKCSTCGHEWQTRIYVRQKHNCPKCGFSRMAAANSSPNEGNRLIDVFPGSVSCWCYERNDGLRPEDVSAGSNKKVWWKCIKCGKEWQTAIYHKAKTAKPLCRTCALRSSGRSYLKPGINDLASCNSRVAEEWNYEKNGSLRPEDVPAHSLTKAWWKCERGHEWEASILSRTKEGYRGCPICSNSRIVEGINDLPTTRPDLVQRWNYEKNGSLRPEDVTAGSNKKVWWKCEKGHEWRTAPNMCGKCPFCINQRVLQGYNDLATVNPELAKEWDYEKNGSLRPEDVVAGSGRKVWWKCSTCGHEWKAPVVERKNGKGCSVCANRVVIKGYNDLATVNPELAKEWNYEKNGDLKPEDVIAGSPKKVWWKCEKGHEWEAVIGSRDKGVRCPICSASRSTSMSEKAVGYYLEKYGVAIEENKKVEGRELDIFIPAMNIAIEYDGQHYHNDRKKDLEKNRLCKSLGIKLIRIREPRLRSLHSTSVDIQIKKLGHDYGYLNMPINQVLSVVLGKSEYDVDVMRDYGAIYERYQKGEVEKSIAKTHPELLKEWDYSRNTIDPDIVMPGSKYMAWWKCSTCGHEWKAPVYSRACNGAGCRKCGFARMAAAHMAVTNEEDSLAAKCPELAAEWNYEKNGSLKPEQMHAGSNKKVWWKCEKGHEWEAPIANRAAGRRCPICANQKLLRGYNDLATVNPELAKEWDYEKNGSLRPEDVVAGSGRKVWWKCSTCGHEWQNTLNARFSRGRGCPVCAGRVTMAGFNDLATTNPEIIGDWNYEKNGDLKPEDVTAGSGRKVWWKCRYCGKEWVAPIAGRCAHQSIGCSWRCRRKYAQLDNNAVRKTHNKR